MNEPNYLNYTINELFDCERNINKEKFPDRYRTISEEIKLRTEAGELPSDLIINEFFAEDVQKLLSLKIWWCFLWRSTAISLVLYLILWVINMLIYKAFGFTPSIVSIFFTAINILCIPLIGTLVMSQALGKNYKDVKIYFRNIQQ